MKTAVSVPDNVCEAAEQLARRLGKSRSELYAAALGSYLQQHRATGVTERLNAIYGSEPELSELDAVLGELQFRSVPKDEWE